MRVHGDKTIRRRKNIDSLKHYKEARDILQEDFQGICGYCGKSSRIMHERFHIDHFVPQSVAEERVDDYYNLVWACPKCNQIKSNKWPTKDKNLHHDGRRGFVDPASEEYDVHLARDDRGFIYGLTELGSNICRELNFHVRRMDLLWKIQQLYFVQDELERLHINDVLGEDEQKYYINLNILLKKYIDDAFFMGE